MSKMYPNGGYRNKTALELPMPTQATPPVVNGNTARVSRKPPTMNLMDYDRERRMGLHGPVGNNSVRINLRNFSDKHGFGLSQRQRDKISQNNGHKIEIDLKGRDYRVNGRGAIARAALKLARELVKGGKRLPKNIYKELVLTILLDAPTNGTDQRFLRC